MNEHCCNTIVRFIDLLCNESCVGNKNNVSSHCLPANRALDVACLPIVHCMLPAIYSLANLKSTPGRSTMEQQSAPRGQEKKQRYTQWACMSGSQAITMFVSFA
jgi:hypothetical protein